MKILSNELKKGMKLIKAVYHNANILIEKDVELTEELISKIKNFGLDEVEVESFLKNEKTEEDFLKEVFQENYEKSINSVKTIISNLESGDLNEEKIEEVVEGILDNIEMDSDILLSLLGESKREDYIFSHSMNTVVVSLIIGTALSYSKEKLELLGKGALLHDIGMTKIGKYIIDKEEKLTEKELEEVKSHTDLALGMLGDVEEEVKQIIKYHHERIDGSGYPEGLKAEEIPEMARIVAIADIYSALTEDRNYRMKFDYYDAMKIVMQSSAKLLDSKILKEFLTYMPIYPINSLVELNDGRIVKVVKANKNPFRPIVDTNDQLRERVDLMDDINLTKYIVGVKK